jgi:hypothetical protein
MPDERETTKGTDEHGSPEPDPAERDADPEDDAKSAPTRGGSNVPNAGRDPAEHRNE